ncbi:hypothetical protein X946_5202 [Burkholderia sp. ABCPW 111]|nr:hypothetical protein X946_5202 [Burkholderia sp. ABCPW 111]
MAFVSRWSTGTPPCVATARERMRRSGRTPDACSPDRCVAPGGDRRSPGPVTRVATGRHGLKESRPPLRASRAAATMPGRARDATHAARGVVHVIGIVARRAADAWPSRAPRFNLMPACLRIPDRCARNRIGEIADDVTPRGFADWSYRTTTGRVRDGGSSAGRFRFDAIGLGRRSARCAFDGDPREPLRGASFAERRRPGDPIARTACERTTVDTFRAARKRIANEALTPDPIAAAPGERRHGLACLPGAGCDTCAHASPGRNGENVFETLAFRIGASARIAEPRRIFARSAIESAVESENSYSPARGRCVLIS